MALGHFRHRMLREGKTPRQSRPRTDRGIDPAGMFAHVPRCLGGSSVAHALRTWSEAFSAQTVSCRCRCIEWAALICSGGPLWVPDGVRARCEIWRRRRCRRVACCAASPAMRRSNHSARVALCVRPAHQNGLSRDSEAHRVPPARKNAVEDAYVRVRPCSAAKRFRGPRPRARGGRQRIHDERARERC